MENEQEFDGDQNRSTASEQERFDELEERLTGIMRRFTTIGGDRLIFSAPSFVPLLLRDLATFAEDPESLLEEERARIARVARATADMLERHQTP